MTARLAKKGAPAADRRVDVISAPGAPKVVRVSFVARNRRQLVAAVLLNEIRRVLAELERRQAIFNLDIAAFWLAHARSSAPSKWVGGWIYGEKNAMRRGWRFNGAGDGLGEALLLDLKELKCAKELADQKLIETVERALAAVRNDNGARQSINLRSGDDIADDLRVDRRMREQLQLRMIGAMDFRKAERIEHAKIAHRDRSKRTMADLRDQRNPDRKPRQLYEQHSNEQQQPWLEEKISRRTWYRRQANIAAKRAAERVAQVCCEGDSLDLLLTQHTSATAPHQQDRADLSQSGQAKGRPPGAAPGRAARIAPVNRKLVEIELDLDERPELALMGAPERAPKLQQSGKIEHPAGEILHQKRRKPRPAPSGEQLLMPLAEFENTGGHA